jgi:hypothetical protein
MDRGAVRHMPDKDEASRLADEIFALVECDQGKGFISDGLGALETADRVFGTVRGALGATERAALKMRAWLRKHGQVVPPGEPDLERVMDEAVVELAVELERLKFREIISDAFLVVAGLDDPAACAAASAVVTYVRRRVDEEWGFRNPEDPDQE